MRHRSIFALVLAGLALSAMAPSGALAQPPSLDRLLERFSELPGLETRYREQKRIALLAVPTHSEGRIYFAPDPDRLLRRQTEPEASAALIADGHLRMRSGDRTEELSIRDNPVLRGFVDSFRAVLAGDREALERFYDAELSARPDAGDDAWELRLTPRDDALRRFLRSITMRGEGVTIESMTMVEVSGDETRTEFFDVSTRRFSASEARRIFRVE